MHVISRKKLQDFSRRHPRARALLDAWFRVARHAHWHDFHDVIATFPQSDVYRQFVIFDIGGNHYRLIAAIHYNREKVFVRHVLTHTEYIRGRWKH